MPKLLLAIVFLWLVPLHLQGQLGFHLPPGRKQVDIPFEYSNNFIILTLNFNRLFPLKFIFDTGAEHTILSKKEVTDLLRLPYEREFKVTGSDLKTPLIAYLVRNIQFDIPDKAYAQREDILVLQEDYFRFEEYAGVNVHGILSANAFSRYYIKINYQKRVITLYDRSTFKLRDDGFKPVDLEIFRNKMYLQTHMQILPQQVIPVKLLVDTGAALPMLLFEATDSLVQVPPNAIPSNIGMGLGGYLEGFTGRIFQLKTGDFEQHNVVTYFQRLDTSIDLSYLNQRNGLIGNILLKHYEIIFDYQNARMWLKPSKLYKEAFVYDRSGISIVASGLTLNTFTVQNVLPGSPAAEAGVQKGDVIKRINVTPALFMSLADMQEALQRKAGRKIHLIIQRNGKRIRTSFVLRDLI